MGVKIEIEIGPRLQSAIKQLLVSVDTVNNNCPAVAMHPGKEIKKAFGISMDIAKMVESKMDYDYKVNFQH